MNSMKRQKIMTLEDEPPRSEGVQYPTGEEQRAITNGSGENEVAGLKQKRNWGVDVSGGKSEVWCCKEQYCIGGMLGHESRQLDVVKQEIARLNNILGISELKCMGVGEFNADDY